MPNKNTIKVVKWFLEKKVPPLIKFEDDESTYQLAQNVVEKNDFIKYPIKKGDSVEVGVKDLEVTFLKKSSAKAETPKTEPQQETSPKKESEEPTEEKVKESVIESNVVTIYAVSGNKEVVKFTKADPWVHVSKEIQAQDYSEIGLMANKKVNVTLENGIIVAVEKIEESNENDSEIPNESLRTNIADSIERQVCIKCATEILKSYIESKHNHVADINNIYEIIPKLTKIFLNSLYQ